MEGLRDVLSTAQLALLKKTLQVDAGEATAEVQTKLDRDKVRLKGRLEGFKLRHAFSGGFGGKDMEFVNVMQQQHEIFTGIIPESVDLKDALFTIERDPQGEVENVVIRGERVRRVVWD